MSKEKKYWLFLLAGTIAVSWYPLHMGFRVIYDMTTAGVVQDYRFPKYIIPYTPIVIAIIAAVLMMPLLLRYAEKLSTGIATLCSVGIFFAAELLFENKVIVASRVLRTDLESWQMFMCYQPPESYETRTWTAVDVLMGEYSPTFKLHFYLIAILLIAAIINCLYGFARMLQTGDKKRVKALVVQAICTALFLGLCILACFTAFFRDGEITVSPLSAFLMGLFFVVMGVTAGVYIGSLLIGRSTGFSILLPAVSGAAVTLAMYIGEMFLLSGNLYLFGTGFFFTPIPGIVLAPVDLLIIVVSGLLTAGICHWLNEMK